MIWWRIRNSGVPGWYLTVAVWLWEKGHWIRYFIVSVVGAAVVVGGLNHRSPPSDLEQAYAELQMAWKLQAAYRAEADEHFRMSEEREEAIADFRAKAEAAKHTPDPAWAEYCEAMAVGNEIVQKAERTRRDNLLRLCAEHRRLAAQAESELRRAQDARDRGAAYPVAPRIKEILTPVLGAR